MSLKAKKYMLSVMIVGFVASTAHAAPGFTFLQLGVNVRASGLGGALT